MTVYIVIINNRLEVCANLEIAEAHIQSEYPELAEECNNLDLLQLIQYVNANNLGKIKLIPKILMSSF